MGTPMLPAFISPEDDAFNSALLLHLINEGNVFDIDLHPQNKDRLQLSFYVNKPLAEYGSKHVDYGFEYIDGKWIPHEFDPFEWEWNHDEEKTGKIDKAKTYKR